MCSLSGCQSRPWILERWAARYSTAVLGFCNTLEMGLSLWKELIECLLQNSLLGAEGALHTDWVLVASTLHKLFV